MPFASDVGLEAGWELRPDKGFSPGPRKFVFITASINRITAIAISNEYKINVTRAAILRCSRGHRLRHQNRATGRMAKTSSKGHIGPRMNRIHKVSPLFWDGSPLAQWNPENCRRFVQYLVVNRSMFSAILEPDLILTLTQPQLKSWRNGLSSVRKEILT